MCRNSIVIPVDSATAIKYMAESNQTAKCPFCAENIKTEAKICKHCGRDVKVVCSMCAKTGRADLMLCEYCGKPKKLQ